MVDLAKEAFSTNNFDLAADIYQRTIKENGPKGDLYLGLADSFAHGGRFHEAFEAYSNAFRLGSVTPEKLRHLATALINCVKKQATPKPAVMSKKCMFTCVLCRGLLDEPVTIPCGHSFCRKCLLKDKSKECQKCGVVHYRLKVDKLKPNVLMCQMIEKWFEKEVKTSNLKSQGNVYFQRGDYENAISLYCKAIDLVADDHLVLSNRSHALACLHQYKAALEDAEKVIQLRPDWPKGYYRKGNALAGLDQYEAAVVAYLQCLVLDPSVDSVKEDLTKMLHKILLPLPPADPKNAQKNPSKLQQLIEDNFSSLTLLLPNVHFEDLQSLETIIQDTITTVNNFSASSTTCVEPMEVGDEDHINDIDGVGKQICRSAPTSRESSPVRLSPADRCRSQSPLHFPSMGSSRKRACHPSATSPVSPTHSSPTKFFKTAAAAAAADVRQIDPSLLNESDFECSLCFRLMYEPVTTPCGHSFCRECLDRSLDHRTVCPLCKGCLTEYLAERRQVVTESIQTVLELYFGQQYEERKRLQDEERAEFARMDKEHEIPLFVCTLAFPTMPCPLHIFEPRYRLMLRRCMESGTRQFGMVISGTGNDDDYCTIGTMLEIRDVQFFPDGRALVDTTGGRRFRVINRGRRDGYNTAKVEFYTDTKIENAVLPELKELETEVYESCRSWLGTLPNIYKDQIHRHFGEFPQREADIQAPTNGPMWAWWAVAVLPLDRQVRMLMLAMRSYKERLDAIRRVLNHIKRRNAQQQQQQQQQQQAT